MLVKSRNYAFHIEKLNEAIEFMRNRLESEKNNEQKQRVKVQLEILESNLDYLVRLLHDKELENRKFVSFPEPLKACLAENYVQSWRYDSFASS